MAEVLANVQAASNGLPELVGELARGDCLPEQALHTQLVRGFSVHHPFIA